MAIITGTDRSNRLTGTDADDTITGGGGHDWIDGGDGADRLFGHAGHDRLFGGDGNDWLVGGDGRDVYLGGSGDDMVVATTQDIYAEGGSGVDTLQLNIGSARPVDFSVTDPKPVNVAGLTITGFERLDFTAGGGDDRVFGGDYDDIVLGQGGDDRLVGLGGADDLRGGFGDDRLQGMHDNDRLSGGEGDDELEGGGADDLLRGDGGVDTARFSAHSANYRFELTGDGGLRVIDTRAPDPTRPGSQTDGVDTLYDIENLRFADKAVAVEEVIRSIRPPVPVADTAATTEDASVSFNLLANDSDPDGDVLSLISVNPTGMTGQVSLGAGGEVTFTPGAAHQGLGAGETATETFTYLVQDTALNTAQGTATVTVTGVNDAPIAGGDRFTIGEDDGAQDVTARLLANDRDADRTDTLTVSAVQATSTAGAALTLSPDGRVTYDPGDLFQGLNVGQTATDTFTYTIRDASGVTSTATATITVEGAADDEGPVFDFMIEEDQVTDNLLDALTELHGVVQITSVGAAGTLGEVLLSEDGSSLIYSTENLDHLLADTLSSTQFTWTGVTIDGVAKQGVFKAYVYGAYDPVTAVDDSVSAAEGQPTENLWNALLSNDIDPEDSINGRYILGVDTTGTVGSVQFDPATRSLVYFAPDLAAGETLTDTFRYTAHDNALPSGTETTATVTITVTGGAGAATVTVESASSSAEGDGFEFSPLAEVSSAGEPFELSKGSSFGLDLHRDPFAWEVDGFSSGAAAPELSGPPLLEFGAPAPLDAFVV